MDSHRSSGRRLGRSSRDGPWPTGYARGRRPQPTSPGRSREGQPLSWPAARLGGRIDGRTRPDDPGTNRGSTGVTSSAASPVAATPATTAPRLEVLGLSWERVQLVIRARAIDGAGEPRIVVPAPLPDPSEQHAEQVTMPATRAWAEGDELRLRFNVMAGPEGLPLEPGRWRLERGGVPVQAAMGAADENEAGPASAGSSWPVASTSATPTIDRTDGTFGLDVSLDLVDAAELARRLDRGPGRTARRLVERVAQGRVPGRVSDRSSDRPADRPTDPVRLGLPGRPRRQPQGRLGSHGRAWAGSRVRDAHAASSRASPTIGASATGSACPGCSPRRMSSSSTTTCRSSTGSTIPRFASSSCGTRPGRSRRSATAASASPVGPARSRASTRTTPTPS